MGSIPGLADGCFLSPNGLEFPGSLSGLQSRSPVPLNDDAQQFTITLEEFVKSTFIPECVAQRKLAGRIHFQFILGLILAPDQFANAFGIHSRKKKPGAKSAPDWPYLGSLPLRLIDQTAVQFLISTALKAEYSTQTVIHIRNVIRSIFICALKTNHFAGNNPAAHIAVPAIARRNPRSLTVSQLAPTMQMMRYPERPIAAFAVLTGMNISEICGLQWKYLNLTTHARGLDSELLPARMMAVRYQSYRGEFRPVINSRKRIIFLPDALFSLCCDLKERSRFTDLDDFVFASRKGTPINPDNFGTRRLKAIGKLLEMPWLSWSAFQRTHVSLKAQFGQRMSRELEKILFTDTAIRNRHEMKAPSKAPDNEARR
jgi:integrase